MAVCAFIGLGVMGYPMAGHLVRKGGHRVTVYNRTETKASKWAGEHGGSMAPTPAEAAAARGGAAFVMLCVGNDDDLRSVVYGDSGALAGMQAGSTLIDHTTASADVACEIAAACTDKGIRFIDAPVSGGQAGAETGALTIMCGGESAAFDTARPVMDCYGKAVTLMGPHGAGQRTKMVNQICIAGLVQGLAEGLNFSEKAGLDSKQVLEVIGQGAAQSWQMDNRGTTMVDGKFDFGFAVDWMRKDLGICLAEAKTNGALLPVTAVVDQFYAELQRMGDGRSDTSSLIKRLSRYS